MKPKWSDQIDLDKYISFLPNGKSSAMEELLLKVLSKPEKHKAKSVFIATKEDIERAKANEKASGIKYE